MNTEPMTMNTQNAPAEVGIDVQRLVRHWKDLGYTEEHHFPGEYILLVHPLTIQKVRVYESGAVWRPNKQGEYVKEPND